MHIDIYHIHNRAEGTYISGTSIHTSHSKEFLAEIHKTECSTGCERKYFGDLSFLEMLTVPLIFSVGWAGGRHQYLTHDATSGLRGQSRQGASALSPSVSVKSSLLNCSLH